MKQNEQKYRVEVRRQLKGDNRIALSKETEGKADAFIESSTTTTTQVTSNLIIFLVESMSQFYVILGRCAQESHKAHEKSRARGRQSARRSLAQELLAEKWSAQWSPQGTSLVGTGRSTQDTPLTTLSLVLQLAIMQTNIMPQKYLIRESITLSTQEQRRRLSIPISSGKIVGESMNDENPASPAMWPQVRLTSSRQNAQCRHALAINALVIAAILGEIGEGGREYGNFRFQKLY